MIGSDPIVAINPFPRGRLAEEQASRAAGSRSQSPTAGPVPSAASADVRREVGGHLREPVAGRLREQRPGRPRGLDGVHVLPARAARAEVVQLSPLDEVRGLGGARRVTVTKARRRTTVTCETKRTRPRRIVETLAQAGSPTHASS